MYILYMALAIDVTNGHGGSGNGEIMIRNKLQAYFITEVHLYHCITAGKRYTRVLKC